MSGAGRSGQNLALCVRTGLWSPAPPLPCPVLCGLVPRDWHCSLPPQHARIGLLGPSVTPLPCQHIGIGSWGPSASPPHVRIGAWLHPTPSPAHRDWAPDPMCRAWGSLWVQKLSGWAHISRPVGQVMWAGGWAPEHPCFNLLRWNDMLKPSLDSDRQPVQVAGLGLILEREMLVNE